MGIHDVWVRATDVNSDTTQNTLGQAVALQPRPGFSRVSSLPDSRAWTAAVETPRCPATLIRSSVEGFGIRLIDNEISKARVFVNELDVVPGLAAVRCLVDPALLVRAKQVTKNGHINGVRVFGIDDNAGDRLRVLEPHLCKGLTTVS